MLVIKLYNFMRYMSQKLRKACYFIMGQAQNINTKNCTKEKENSHINPKTSDSVNYSIYTCDNLFN